jgi:hypothetical protein
MADRPVRGRRYESVTRFVTGCRTRFIDIMFSNIYHLKLSIASYRIFSEELVVSHQAE